MEDTWPVPLPYRPCWTSSCAAVLCSDGKTKMTAKTVKDCSWLVVLVCHHQPLVDCQSR
jgi:hypothetical protein